MKLALVALLFLASSAAYADSKKDIEAAVKGNVVGLAKLEKNPRLAKNAVVVIARGEPGNLAQKDACLDGLANQFYGCLQAEVAHKLGKITVVADDARGLGWFQAPFTIIISGEDDEGKPSSSKQGARIAGIAKKNGKKWEIAAAMYVETISDKDLFARTDTKPATAAPKLTGDQDIAKTAAAWFPTGFTASASATATNLLASGTSPTEFGSGPAALKLTKTWDTLKLGAHDIDAKLIADGVGWVRVTVALPKKTGGKAIEMILTAVVIKEGETWRWVSLQFMAPSRIG